MLSPELLHSLATSKRRGQKHRAQKIANPPKIRNSKRNPGGPRNSAFAWLSVADLLSSKPNPCRGSTNNISLEDSARSHFTVCKHTYDWRYLGKNRLFCYIRFTSAFVIGLSRRRSFGPALSSFFPLGILTLGRHGISMPTLPTSTTASNQHTECHLHVRDVVASVPWHSLGLPKIPSSPSAQGSHFA